eukprot:8837035-Prorocentrum_lima.AAC.1
MELRRSEDSMGRLRPVAVPPVRDPPGEIESVAWLGRECNSGMGRLQPVAVPPVRDPPCEIKSAILPGERFAFAP